MLGKTPNQVYDPFLKAGLDYKNPERLKKAIAAQPKMYHGEKLYSTKLKIDSPDSEETLEDAEEKQKNELLENEIEKISNDSKDIQANLLKRIKILENDFKRSQAQALILNLNSNIKKRKWLVMSHGSQVQARKFHSSQRGRFRPCAFEESSDSTISRPEVKLSLTCIRDRSTSNTPVTTQKWVAKLSTLTFAFISCDASDSARLWIVDSGCSKHMTGNLQLLRNFVEKFMGTVRFRNDHFAAITEYGDYVQVNLTKCHVYYVEGLGHNLLSVGQFCDGDLEVAFRSNTCYVWNLEGDDLLTACEQSKSKKASLPPKLVPSTESKLELLHMDLCGPMRVASINGKKYILVIVDDYSWYT
ncbi:integrase, catalytic region, zinc finger, CCHC-type containing protein [Tanacetum coccineum]